MSQSKKQRVNYVGDFETTTDPADCRVWAWFMCDVDQWVSSEQSDIPAHVEHGTDIDGFVQFCSSLYGNVYFHNLAFDGSFIIDSLFRSGYTHSLTRNLRKGTFSTLISGMGKFYSITVRWFNGVTTEFRDSLKKLPMSVAHVSKAFKLVELKGSIDYDEYRPVGHELTDEEIAYGTNDVVIIAKALRQQFDEGMTRLTVGSDSLYEFKSVCGSPLFSRVFPVLPLTMDAEIRSAYRGGFTYVAERFKGKIVGPGKTYDVNSLYPSVMYDNDMPYGEPVYFTGVPKNLDRYPLYIIAITLTAKLKKDHIPCIQVKGSGFFNGVEYLTEINEPVTISCTSVDLKLWQDHYDLNILSYDGGWQFKSIKGLFKDFIDKWMSIKATSDDGLRVIAKLHLNSLYGKFATNPDITGKVPVYENGIVKLVKGLPETRDPVYTPVGVFITAYARDVTIRAAQQHYDRFVYADTDSLHLLDSDGDTLLDVHPSRMGAWKHEMDWENGLFVRAKCYTERSSVGTYTTHIAGMPEVIASQMTFGDFVHGTEFRGKLQPQRVPGGIVLKDVGFTLNM